MTVLQLLTAFEVGGQTLRNRVVLSPMTRARCTPTTSPFDVECTLANDLMKTYYEQRASAGLLVTEGTHFSEESSGWRNAPFISSIQHAEAWKVVVDAVHAKGAVMYCQLWHLGRYSHSSFHPTKNRIISASAIAIPPGTTVKTTSGDAVEPEVPHALTKDEIQDVIAEFVNAAEMAKLAGFDGVELHGANGYIIDQFLQSSSNHRDDEYGGSKENRVRLLVEIFQAIVDSGAYPANRIGFRLSPNGAFGGMGSSDNFETFVHVAKTMNTFQPAYLHLMDGLGFGYHGLDKAVRAADIRKVFDGPIICNVGLERDTAEGMIRSGATDLTAFGRIYISNPDLVERFQNNWPVRDPAPYDDWWSPKGGNGYIDYPTYDEEQKSKAQDD